MSKKSNKTIFWFAWILAAIGCNLIHQACEFDSTEIYYEEIDMPIGEMPTAELSFEDSIVILHQATRLSYKVNFDRQEVLQVEFYLNDRLYGSDDDAMGNVLIDPGPGIHLFEMVIYTSTESGSIAEKVGAEAFVYSQSWEIIMEDPENRQVNIDLVYIDEEGVRIEWSRSMGFDFQSYEILRVTSTGEASLGIFEDRDVTFCIDPYYIGGDAEYNLRLRTHHFPPADGIKRSFSLPPYQLFIVPVDSTSLTFTWSGCYVESNFGSYTLYSGTGISLYESSEVQDTTITLALDPATDHHFRLEYSSSIKDPVLGFYSVEREYYLGTNSLPEYEVITQSMYPPYRVHTPSFSYNPQSEEFTYHDYPDHRGIFAVTPQNRYLLAGNHLYEGTEFQDLKQVLTHIPADVFGRSLPRVSLSLNMNRAYFESDHNAHMFSLRGDKVLEAFGENSRRGGVLSPGGDHLLTPNYWYNSLDIYETSNLSGNYHMYIRTDVFPCNGDPVYISEEEFVVVSGNEIVKWNGKEYELIMSASTSAKKTLCYDPMSHTVLAASHDRLYVYDAGDLSIILEKPVDSQYSLQFGHVAYMNKTAFLRGKTQGHSVMLPLSFQ